MYSENSNRAKSNCKGFTLIELIIVITILSVLTGLLVPQFFKYIEKTRLDADNAVIDEIVQAMRAQGIEGELPVKESDDFYGYQIAHCSLVRYPGEEKFHIWLKPCDDYDYIEEFVKYYEGMHGYVDNFKQDDAERLALNSYRIAELIPDIELFSNTYKNNIPWYGIGNNSYQEILIVSAYNNRGVTVFVNSYIDEVYGTPSTQHFY